MQHTHTSQKNVHAYSAKYYKFMCAFASEAHNHSLSNG